MHMARLLNLLAELAWATGRQCHAATNACYRLAGRLYGWSYEVGKR